MRIINALGAGALLALGTLAAASDESRATADDITLALQRADQAVERIIAVADSQRTFANTIGAIDDLFANLELDTNMTQFMAYVSTDADERKLGLETEQRYSNWLIGLGKNEALFNAVKAYADTNPELEGEQARLLEHTLRDFRRAGMALSSEQRDELKAVQERITELSIQFEANIRDDETVVPLTRDELPGLPADYFAGLKIVDGMYLVGMAYPQSIPVFDMCDDETTRKKVWLAYKRRGGQKNVGVLQELLELRAQAAEMLGYDNAAEYEIEVKMAKTPDNVMDFYQELRPLVRQKAQRDYAELVAAKRAHTGDPDAKLQPWDSSYYVNYLKKTKYAVDPEEVRQYFPLDRVMDGLFSITQSLYGLEYRDITGRAASEGRPIWHEDVKLYEVWDKGTGDMLGEFYIDLHPRDNKYGHAAQWGLAQHKVWTNGDITRPLAALVCNFTKPTDDKPSLMTHDEVETFFHEFGHCLHTILSEARYYDFAGTSVERDFVEAPSQMFENWVWNADVLNTFAAHYKTGEQLPADLLQGMIAARNLGSGMLAERQFYYGLFDMNCHLDPEGDVDTNQLALDLWDPTKDDVELYEPVPETHFHAAFGHLTGYQAGYYGYQWSLVYASDMFQRFKELGMLDPEAGMYYRKKILARGGTMDGLDLVRDYLGREPDMSAYLKHLGLEN